jgi:hypothetical protein
MVTSSTCEADHAGYKTDSLHRGHGQQHRTRVFRQTAAERHKDRRCLDGGGSELGCYHASSKREGTGRRTANNRKLGRLRSWPRLTSTMIAARASSAHATGSRTRRTLFHACAASDGASEAG